MNYSQTLTYLYSRLPMYQRIGKAAYKADLNNTIALCDLLGNPEKKIKSVHIAGTNGKGSVAHMIASVLQEAGYKTGLYTSPHLKDFRERIKINGLMIPEDFVIDFVAKHYQDFEKIELSFFEMTVGLAFDYFVKQKTDIVIVETGLGGRLDSTNVIKPLVSTITNIDYDHTALLGNTLQKIAYEKAGIIKRNTPVVIGQTQEEIIDVFVDKASIENSNLYFADKIYKTGPFNTENIIEVTHLPTGAIEYFSVPLKGNYQKYNLVTALNTIDVLEEKGFSVSKAQLMAGIKNTVSNTGLMGRWQVLSEKPKVICDTAHNTAGLKIVIEQLQSLFFENLHIVLGMVNDKEADDMLRLFPGKAIYYFCRPDIPRGLAVDVLAQAAAKYKLNGKTFESVDAAYKQALIEAKENDIVFVGGSTFVVAEVV